MKKILVIDNHPVMLKFMTDLLEKQGHQVLTAEDGLSALAILESYIPDIIFVDLIMPNISGDKLCPIIRAKPELKDVYLVILSAIAAEKEIKITEFGANACIAKGPFNIMAEYVFATIDQLDRDETSDLSKDVMGLQHIHQRNITKELLRSKEHIELILNNMSEAIFELNDKEKIVYVNPSAIALIGIPEEKLLSSNFSELFHKSHQNKIRDVLDVDDDAQNMITEESAVMLKGKQVSLNVLPFQDEEQRSLIVIMNNVSERKRMKARIERAQKTEAIVTLASGIAHEFNNCLMGISGNMDLLQIYSQGDERLNKYAKAMKRSLTRIVGLTSQLLAYARRGKYEPQNISINAFVEDALTIIRHSMESSVKVKTNLAKHISKVEVDPSQMQMVLSSVIANSVEAMEGPGTINISTREEKIDEEYVKHLRGTNPGAYYVCLTVKDDGKGMGEETISRMFEPFFTTKFLGRGLSMAAVFGIINNHDGWISVDSELDKGTEVHIYLPAVNPQT